MKTVELISRARMCARVPPHTDVINKGFWLALKSDIQTTAMIISAKSTTPTKIFFKDFLNEYIKTYS